MVVLKTNLNISPKGYFVMVLGGFNGGDGDLDDVELVSLDPTSSQHVPDCLAQLSPLPVALLNAAGALDLNREYSSVPLMALSTKN